MLIITRKPDQSISLQNKNGEELFRVFAKKRDDGQVSVGIQSDKNTTRVIRGECLS